MTVSEDQLKLAAARWILKHREGHRIPQSVMESLISGAGSLFKTACTAVHDLVMLKMEEGKASSDLMSSVSGVFSERSQYTEVFKGLETTYLQNKFIEANLPFVVSKYYSI